MKQRVMGKLTWEEAEALVERAYNPFPDLHPSMRILPGSPHISNPNTKFAQEFLRKLRQRMTETESQSK